MLLAVTLAVVVVPLAVTLAVAVMLFAERMFSRRVRVPGAMGGVVLRRMST